MPEKSDDAFRTIREVADWLGVPTHVLRFWESKFSQVAPVKGAGGRRYYRPDDMRLLGGIKVLLHDRGMTIRAVSQRIEEEGVELVRRLSPALEAAAEATSPRARRVIRKGDEAEGDRVVSLDAARPPIAKDPPSPLEETIPDQPDAPVAVQVGEAPAPPAADALPEAPAPEPPGTPLDAEPPGTDGPPVPSAPDDTEGQVRHSPEPEPLPDAPAPAPAAGPAVGALTAAARLVAASGGVGAADRKRLRRVLRRWRALRDEIADDLAEGTGG